MLQRHLHARRYLLRTGCSHYICIRRRNYAGTLNWGGNDRQILDFHDFCHCLFVHRRTVPYQSQKRGSRYSFHLRKGGINFGALHRWSLGTYYATSIRKLSIVQIATSIWIPNSFLGSCPCWHSSGDLWCCCILCWWLLFDASRDFEQKVAGKRCWGWTSWTTERKVSTSFQFKSLRKSPLLDTNQLFFRNEGEEMNAIPKDLPESGTAE